MARRSIFLAIVAAATVAIVVPITVFGLPAGKSDPEAFSHVYTFPDNGNQTHLHVDADPTNGTRPCDPIDTTRTVQVGDTYDVALCLESYAPHEVKAFKLRVYYDDINESPTLEGTGPMLDLNPDANDGNDDVTGLTLGSNWDCSGFGFLPPTGDDPNTPCQDEWGRPVHPCLDATIACNHSVLNPDDDLTANPGLLATVQFTALDVGTEALTWGSDTEVGGPNVILPGGGLAYCGPDVPEGQIACFGATINKVVFDCVFEDDFDRGTYLGLLGNDWEFGSPEGTLNGTGRVMRFSGRVFVFGRGQGFYVAGFGTCPLGPGRAFALDFTSFPPRFLRVQDVTGGD